MTQPEPKTANEASQPASQQAIDWQYWASNQNLSYGELADWNDRFSALANKFGLAEEFKENGVI